MGTPQATQMAQYPIMKSAIDRMRRRGRLRARTCPRAPASIGMVPVAATVGVKFAGKSCRRIERHGKGELIERQCRPDRLQKATSLRWSDNATTAAHAAAATTVAEYGIALQTLVGRGRHERPSIALSDDADAGRHCTWADCCTGATAWRRTPTFARSVLPEPANSE